MSRRPRAALLVVRWAAALLPDPGRRARYREQWEAGVWGADDLGLSPLRLALGAAVAAARMAALSALTLLGGLLLLVTG